MSDSMGCTIDHPGDDAAPSLDSADTRPPGRPMRLLAVGPSGGRLPSLLPSLLRSRCRAGWLALALGRASLLHVDAAAEVRTFGNRHARRRDIAIDRPVVADVHFFRRADVAGDFAQDDHGLGEHLRLDSRIRTDREHVLTQLDLALDLSFNREILAAV